MNTLFQAINQPLAQRVCWVLLHSLWQGALIGAAFGLVRFALRRSSANARYLAGCVALGLLLTAPIPTLLLASPPSHGARPPLATTSGYHAPFPSLHPPATPHPAGGSY